jgi:hypothetical protein
MMSKKFWFEIPIELLMKPGMFGKIDKIKAIIAAG